VSFVWPEKMSIEQGMVILVQGNAGVSAIAPLGGFLAELPKGQALPSWTYLYVSDQATYTLTGPDPLTMRRLQIDCYANAGADIVKLAAAIDAVLNGFKGLLSDQQTLVQGCFRSNLIDFPFDDVARTYRRMLEYQLWFNN